MAKTKFKSIVVEVKTSCKNCTHMETCKFRHAAAELFKTNLMYSMFEYLEWNHLLDSFDTNARGCKFYTPNFIDGPIKYGVTPPTLISTGLSQWFKEMEVSWGRWITPSTGSNAGVPEITLKDETEPRPPEFFEKLITLKRI